MRFLVLLLFPFSLLGQTISLNLPPQMNGLKFSLIEYNGLFEPTVDSAIAKDGSVALNSSGYAGVGSIQLNGSELAQVIVPSGNDLSGTIMYRGGSLGVGWQSSKENEALAELMTEGDQYATTVTEISKLMEQIDEFDPKRTSRSDSLEAVYHETLAAYNIRLFALREKHKGTYAADVLVGLDVLPMRQEKPEWLAKYDNDPAFMHRHYFHHVNFKDDRILRNPFLKNKVLEYLFNYSGRDVNGLNAAIDLILSEADVNQTVKASVAEILIGFFREKDMVDQIEYINQEHLASCNAELSPEIAKLLSEVSPFKKGDAIPSLEVKTIEGELSDITATSKDLKAIMFWASWCNHCEEELPGMADFIRGYEEKLEFATFSLDSVEANWRAAAETFPDPILHYSDLKVWESEVPIKFGVTATPTFILLDSNRKYLGRASTFSGLERLIGRQD